MAKDAIYEGARKVRTFVDLAHGADVLIAKTEQEPKGSYYTTMSAFLLTGRVNKGVGHHCFIRGACISVLSLSVVDKPLILQ